MTASGSIFSKSRQAPTSVFNTPRRAQCWLRGSYRSSPYYISQSLGSTSTVKYGSTRQGEISESLSTRTQSSLVSSFPRRSTWDAACPAGTFTSGSPSRITINFTPSRQTTTRMRLKLEVSQFNFEPIVCTVVGSCVDMESHATQKLRLENIKGHAALQEASATAMITGSLEPHEYPLISSQYNYPGVKQHPRKVPKRQAPANPSSNPTRTKPQKFNQSFVNSLLNRQTGKMTIAEMKEAIRRQQDYHKDQIAAIEREIILPDRKRSPYGEPHTTDFSDHPDLGVDFKGNTVHLQEMIFLRKLRFYCDHEKSLANNSTKCRIGQVIMTNHERKGIIDKWRKEGKECERQQRERERTRNRTEFEDGRVTFPVGLYQSTDFNEGRGEWDAKTIALRKWVETMSILVIRERVNRRLQSIKKILASTNLATPTINHKCFPFSMSRDTLKPVLFPVVDSKEINPEPVEIIQVHEPFRIRRFSCKHTPAYRLLDYTVQKVPALVSYQPTHTDRTHRSGALDELGCQAPRGLSPGNAGSINAQQIALHVRKNPGVHNVEALLATLDMKRKEDAATAASEAKKRESHAVPNQLILQNSWSMRGLKEWPYLLLRSHPSLYVYSPRIPQSEVDSGAYALRPRAIGNLKKQKFYLIEEVGCEALAALQQVPKLFDVYKGVKNERLDFSFAALQPIGHPDIDLDAPIPLQSQLADDDKMSDSDTDDEETSFKPLFPTVELCRSMFLSNQERASLVEGESSLASAMNKAWQSTNERMENDRMNNIGWLPKEIERVNSKTADPRYKIAGLFSCVPR
ncbi:hypothetical protein AAMO2058_000416500 [Amorphochlora amoebiformis]